MCVLFYCFIVLFSVNDMLHPADVVCMPMFSQIFSDNV